MLAMDGQSDKEHSLQRKEIGVTSNRNRKTYRLSWPGRVVYHFAEPICCGDAVFEGYEAYDLRSKGLLPFLRA